MAFDVQLLSEREKDVLRLLSHGHDAKSCARELGISVAAVNERLRNARRKLGVSSSREAARLLAGAEPPGANSLVDGKIGVAVPIRPGDAGSRVSTSGKRRYALAAGGLCAMLIVTMIAIVASHLSQTNASEPLPNWTVQAALPDALSGPANRIHLTGNRLLWNGEEASEADIRNFLAVERQMMPQPVTIFSHDSRVAPERVQRMRQMIDGALHCTSATCVEVTGAADDRGTSSRASRRQ